MKPNTRTPLALLLSKPEGAKQRLAQGLIDAAPAVKAVAYIA